MGKLNTLLDYLIAAVVVIIATSFFYFKDKPLFSADASHVSSKDMDKVVNKYIHETSTDVLRQKLITDRALVEARKKIAEIEKVSKLKQQKEQESIPAEKQIWKEADMKSVPQPQVAESSDGAMSESEKRDYARQYIENARRGGYEIELNKDLEVIKVTPIRKPSQENDSYESYPSN